MHVRNSKIGDADSVHSKIGHVRNAILGDADNVCLGVVLAILAVVVFAFQTGT